MVLELGVPERRFDNASRKRQLSYSSLKRRLGDREPLKRLADEVPFYFIGYGPAWSLD